MKVKIDPKAVNHERKKAGLSFIELEELTSLNKNRWMYVLRSGGFVTESELEEIADALQCDYNILISSEFQLRLNTPIEIDLLVRNLYERRKGDIQPFYENAMKGFRKNGNIERFIGEANRLLDAIFPSDTIDTDPLSGLRLIVDDFQKDRLFSNSHAELDEQTVSDIFRFMEDSVSSNIAQQAIAVFLYSIVIFDIVFLEESIASITQYELERFGDKALQYCTLTKKTEALRDLLISRMVNNELVIFENMTEEVAEEILFGVQVMLLSCYRAGKHINSCYFSSEHVNRTELDAVITRLFQVMEKIGIVIPDIPIGMPGTRFFNHLCYIRTLKQSSKQNNFIISPLEGYCFGLINGRNGY